MNAQTTALRTAPPSPEASAPVEDALIDPLEAEQRGDDVAPMAKIEKALRGGLKPARLAGFSEALGAAMAEEPISPEPVEVWARKSSPQELALLREASSPSKSVWDQSGKKLLGAAGKKRIDQVFDKALTRKGGDGAADDGAALPDDLSAGYQDEVGDAHDVYIEEGSGGPELIRASEPAPLEAYLEAIADYIDSHGSESQKLAHARAVLLQQEVVAFTDPDTGDGRAWRPQDGDVVRVKLTELAGLLRELPSEAGVVGVEARPPSAPVWATHAATVSNGRGGTMQSQDSDGVSGKISINPGGNSGSEPSYISPLLGAVNALRGGNARYIAGHMLNHHVHGKGSDAENLAPISGSSNTAMVGAFEKSAKEAVLKDNEVLDYKVKPVWPGGRDDTIGPESSLPTALDVQITKNTYHGDAETAAKREDPANWQADGGNIYQGNYPLTIQDSYLGVRQDLDNKAAVLENASDHYRQQAVKFAQLPPPLQLSVNTLYAEANAIRTDGVQMHNYLTHYDTIDRLNQEWAALEVQVLFSWPGRASRKRKTMDG